MLPKIKKNKKQNFAFALFVSLVCIVMIFIPTGFENAYLEKDSEKSKAQIISVNNSNVQSFGVVVTGTQKLVIEIVRGKFKGEQIEVSNILMGDIKLDKIYKLNDKVLAILQTNEQGNKIISARADDIYRINVELILFGIFALFLILFAGWTGFNALLSFVFTALSIWKILIPLYLKGYQPIPIALIIVSLTTAVIILLISGFTKKGIVALSGSIVGITVTSILGLLFGYFFKIPGTVQEFSDTLLYVGFSNIKLSDIFMSAIFISAAGAVMDVAMDIASAQNELIEKRPDMKSKELMRSGFSIAYPVIGTMTTTLLFAYSGSFIFVFMVFMSKGTPMINIFNTNYIAAEILHTLIGSFGLVLVAPATAIIGSYVYTIKS